MCPSNAPYLTPWLSRNVIAFVLSYPAMRAPGLILAIVLIGSNCTAQARDGVQRERRQRAAAAFHDGILLFHASSELDLTADGFRQDPLFYYFTGLGNTVVAPPGLAAAARDSMSSASNSSC